MTGWNEISRCNSRKTVLARRQVWATAISKWSKTLPCNFADLFLAKLAVKSWRIGSQYGPVLFLCPSTKIKLSEFQELLPKHFWPTPLTGTWSAPSILTKATDLLDFVLERTYRPWFITRYDSLQWNIPHQFLSCSGHIATSTSWIHWSRHNTFGTQRAESLLRLRFSDGTVWTAWHPCETSSFRLQLVFRNTAGCE